MDETKFLFVPCTVVQALLSLMIRLWRVGGKCGSLLMLGWAYPAALRAKIEYDYHLISLVITSLRLKRKEEIVTSPCPKLKSLACGWALCCSSSVAGFTFVDFIELAIVLKANRNTSQPQPPSAIGQVAELEFSKLMESNSPQIGRMNCRAYNRRLSFT